MIARGVLHVVGVGPGDPELMTLKAVRIVAGSPVIAHFAKRGQPGHAREIAHAHIAPRSRELRFEYPFTTEIAVDDPRYRDGITSFYAECAARLAEELDIGADVALLCEGDPFFYGSSLALVDRLASSYRSVVVPGVTGMSGCWTQARTPMTHGDDVLTVLPGTLDQEQLAAHLAGGDAAVIIKVGRNLEKIRAALRHADVLDRAIYVERGTMAGERVVPFTALESQSAPYFSLVLVPGRRHAR
jgi:precorrin-2/cobalt-factor-2 C20-methyltransferase